MVFKKVAIYLRKSRFDDESETLEKVLERHEKLLVDYCKRNHLIVVKTYKEVVSGENIENRPQVQKLLEDVSEGLYDGVVVVEIERLSRGNPVDQVEILDTFKDAKSKIYTLQKVYDFSTDNDIDEDYFEFGLFMSRREYKIIKRRLMRGKKQAQKEGFFTGPYAPYGYDRKRVNKGFILVPNEQAEVVKIIFNKLAYENCTPSDVHEYLLRNKIPSPFGLNNWDMSSIRKMVKNKTYIGYINIGTRARANVSIVKGQHEPIIDEDTFNIVQEKMLERTTKVKRGRDLVNPLAGVLFCGYCNKSIYRNLDCQKYRTAPKSHYNCRTRHCQCSGALQQAVEERVVEELKKELKNFNYFLDNYDVEIKSKKNTVIKEIELNKKELAKKEKMLNRCCELLEEGVYSKEKYTQRASVLEEDIETLKSNLKDLEAQTFEKEDRIKHSIPILEKVIAEYWNLSVEDKNKLLKAIIDHIEYKKETKYEDFELKIFMKI